MRIGFEMRLFGGVQGVFVPLIPAPVVVRLVTVTQAVLKCDSIVAGSVRGKVVEDRWE